VRVAFAAGTRLAVGTPVRTEIIAEQRPQVIAVPLEALVTEDDSTFVMVATGDKAQKRKVETGLRTPKSIEITSGLKPGDAVIVKGQQGLPDGASISVAK